MLGILVSIGLAAALVLGSTSPAPAAESPLVLGSGKRTESVVVATGKSQNIRTEASFVDVVVGDPEIADVLPLTDHSLSILGKKIGTTRVSVYGEGKRQIGIFDIEVSYDISRLATEIRAVTGPGIRVSSVNGRIMLSGMAADAVGLDKAVMIARQF